MKEDHVWESVSKNKLMEEYRMKQSVFGKVLALCLTFAMLLSVLPATALAAEVELQPLAAVSANATERTVTQNELIFSDRDSHKWAATAPSYIMGSSYLYGSLSNGVILTVQKAGWVYVMTPNAGGSSQMAALEEEGFSVVDTFSDRVASTITETIVLMGKEMEVGQTLTVGKWGIVLATIDTTVLAENAALEAPAVILEPQEGEYIDGNRPWQGIPSLAVDNESGRIWVTWYSGGPGESNENYCLIFTSDDDGDTWEGPQVVVDPTNPVRAYDPNLWLDPDGRLWFIWCQSYDALFDGRAGVWAMYTDEPEKEAPQWSDPVRIANGVCMCDPLVVNEGKEDEYWLLPTSIWMHWPAGPFDMYPEGNANVYKSVDKGMTWEYLGTSRNTEGGFEAAENMVIELNDGTLQMLVRSKTGIDEAFSTDGGKTWTDGVETHITPVVSRFWIGRLDSGAQLMIYNNPPEGDLRTHMTAALSYDDGETWPYRFIIDERFRSSYPDAQQDADGNIYIIYDRSRTVRGEILIAKINEEDIRAGKLVTEGSYIKKTINENMQKTPKMISGSVSQLESGYYVLEDDVTLTDTIAMETNGYLIIDLDGHTMTAPANKTAFTGANYTKLIINDTAGGGKIVGNGTVSDSGSFAQVGWNGSLILNGGTITGFTATGYGTISGGSNRTVVINGGAITGNKAANGGAVFLTDDSSLTVNGGTISDNEASNGGAVYIGGKGIMTVNGGTISGNTAANGGVFYGAAGSSLTVWDGAISGNTASSSGGVAAVFAENTIEVYGGTISGNTALYGGVFKLESEEAALYIHGGTFTGNSDTGNGASVVHGNNAGYVEMTGGTITENGNSYALQISQAEFKMTGGEISGNTGKDLNLNNYQGTSSGDISGTAVIGSLSISAAKGTEGQAGYIPAASVVLHDLKAGAELVSDTALTVSETDFSVNTEQIEGSWKYTHHPATVLTGSETQLTEGGYELPEGGMTMSGTVTVYGNVTIDLMGQTLTLPNSTRAFKVYNSSGSPNEANLTIKDTVGGGKVMGNGTCGSAGTLAYVSGGIMTVENIEICGIASTANGAVFQLDKNGSVTVSGGRIAGNATTANGGVFYGIGGTITVTDDAVISGNTAKNGAVVYCSNADTVTIRSGRFLNNAAVANGGVIAVYGAADVTIHDGSFTGNTAAQKGGVVKIENLSSEMTIHGGTFTGNEAGVQGALIHGDIAGYVEITGGTFTGNNSAQNEAILISQATFVMTGGTITDNTMGNLKINNYGGTSTGDISGNVVIGSMNVNSARGTEGTDSYIPQPVVTIHDLTGQADVTSNKKLVIPEEDESVKETQISGGYQYTCLNNVLCGGETELTEELYLAPIGGVTMENTVTVMGSVTIDLRGQTLTAPEGIRMFNIYDTSADPNEANLTIMDSVGGGRIVGGGTGSVNGALAYVSGTATLTIENGQISGFNTTGNGMIYVDNSGSVVMEGGTVSDNTAANGGVAYLSGGSFTVNGGTISGNTATNHGGVFYSGSTNTITIHGGTIAGNEAAAGGVLLNQGAKNMVFAMDGGTISGNTTTGGSTIQCNYGTVGVTGGAITGNTDNGTILNLGGSVTVRDAVVEGDKGAILLGHYWDEAKTPATANVSGSAVIGGGGIHYNERSGRTTACTLNIQELDEGASVKLLSADAEKFDGARTAECVGSDETYTYYNMAHTEGEPVVDGNDTVISCSVCGIELSRVTNEPEFVIAAADIVARPVLGNAIDFQFGVPKSAVSDWTGYYAVVSKEVYGAEDSKTTLTSDQWGEAGTYWAVEYSGMAAKEMNDQITMQIFDAQGNAVSEAKVYSIGAYAMNNYASLNDEYKTLLVDMLNYGAEAQKQFSYDTENLVNAVLTEEQQAMATQSVTVENRQVSGDNFYMSRLVLESRIQLQFGFTGIDEDCYAEYSYMSHTGVQKTGTVPIVKVGGSIYGAFIEDQDAADGRNLVTVKVYDADGEEVASAADSVEGYVARNSTVAINLAIMKYCDAANAALH